MKKLIVILILCLPTAAFSQLPDCYKFREGRFRIEDSRAGVVTVAERRGGYQTESSESLKAVVRFRISWQDDCSYTLRLDKVIRNENKIDFPPDLTITIHILETNTDWYTQEINSSLSNGSYRVRVTKLN